MNQYELSLYLKKKKKKKKERITVLLHILFNFFLRKLFEEPNYFSIAKHKIERLKLFLNKK